MNESKQPQLLFDEIRSFRSLVIASKMMAYFVNHNDYERSKTAFLLGFIHDVGYFLGGDTDNHQRLGGELLKLSNYKYFNEVYYHNTGSANYFSDEYLLLELADITTSEDGRHIRINESLNYVRDVYGENSFEYKKFMRRITLLEQNSDLDTLVSIRDFFNSLAGGAFRCDVIKMTDSNKFGSFFDDDDATVFSYDDFEFGD